MFLFSAVEMERQCSIPSGKKNMAVENIRIYGKKQTQLETSIELGISTFDDTRGYCAIWSSWLKTTNAWGRPRSTCFMPMTTLRCPPERPVRTQPWRRLQLSRGGVSTNVLKSFEMGQNLFLPYGWGNKHPFTS